MHTLSIQDFGPIRQATVTVQPLLVLIGPQSSGKSTIAKLVYFFLHVRDEIIAFLLERAREQPREQSNDRPDRVLQKRLRNRFIEFFGPVPQSKSVRVVYDYGRDHLMTITLDQRHHRFVTLAFSEPAWRGISSLIRETEGQLSIQDGAPPPLTAIGKLMSDQREAALIERIRKELADIFSFDKELLFIPAGRSLLSTASDQMQYIHPHLLDYPMRRFVETVSASRSFFEKSLDDIILDRQALSSTEVWFSAVRKARGYIRRVLKGEYRHDREGGKIFVTPDVYTKIGYASSGQQEAVWILLSLFLLVLERTDSLVVVEEPEAHLFPSAQKDIMEYISFVLNAMNCHFIVTTHSPYLLACINNMMYARQLSEKVADQSVESIMSKNIWLDPDRVSGYLVADGTVEDLYARDIQALKCELLDGASDLINEDYERLLHLEAVGARA